MVRVPIPNSCIKDDLSGEARIYYDASIHDTAIGTVELPLEIPNGAIIVEAVYDVLEAFTSGGAATVSLGLNTAVDILAATAIGSVTGVAAAKTAGDAFKLTADRKLKLAIATAALTAGKLGIYVRWVGPFNPTYS